MIDKVQGVEWQCVVVARCTVAEPVSCVGGDDDASGERRAGPVAKLQGSTIVSTVCGGRALFNLSLLSKDTREGASAIGLPSGFWQLLGPGRANTECRPALTANKAPCCCIACGNGAQPCSQQPAAHSSARSAQCAVAHSTASAKRRANKKAKGAPVSISYML